MTRPDEIPEDLGERGVVEKGEPVGQGAEEQRVPGRQLLDHGLVQGEGHRLRIGRREQQRGVLGEGEHHPAVFAGQRAGTRPLHLAARAQLVQERGGVVADPGRQDQMFERAGRNSGSLELFDGAQNSIGPRAARAHGLPRRQEAAQCLRRDGFHIVAEPGQRAPAQPPEHVGRAPLGAAAPRPERAVHDLARGRELVQRADHRSDAETEPVGDLRGGERPVRTRVPGHEIAEWVRDRFQVSLRDPWRGHRAQRVAESSHVFGRDPARLPGDADGYRPSGALQGRQPRRLHAAYHRLVDRQIAQDAQQVGGVLQVAGTPVGRASLELGLHLRQRIGVEKLAELSLAQQFGEQGRIDGQRLRAPLGQRGIPLVEEGSDVAEEQRPGEW